MPLGDDLKQLPQEHQGPLVKLGKGDLGGKARGLSFLESLIEMYSLRSEFSPHRVQVPETVVLATGEYDRFLARNDLGEGQDAPNRPLLLYRESFEGARACVDRCGERLVGVISDLEFPREGVLDPRAGLYLTRYVKERVPSVPVIVQSHDRELEHEVQAGIAAFLWKGSDQLLHVLHALLDTYCGFGDFVFRDEQGGEIARGHDLCSLADCVRSVPLAVFRYHGSRNHFSAWLSVHGEFELAREARRLSAAGPESRARFLALLEGRLASGTPAC